MNKHSFSCDVHDTGAVFLNNPGRKIETATEYGLTYDVINMLAKELMTSF